MRVRIEPGAARGTLQAPPSKSMAHRLLIAAALARGESVLRRVPRSQDVLATADCLRAMGASVSREGGEVRVRGFAPRESGPARLPCRESGSTLRFLLPLCLLSGDPKCLEGSQGLLSRPLSVYEDLCRARGLLFQREPGGVAVAGPLAPGEFAVPGDVSSQFITGLLFALPLLEGPSALRLIPPVESRPYVDLTLAVLARAGVGVGRPDPWTLEIPGGGAYAPLEAEVEGDYSGAAFFAALNCLGGSVEISGLRPDSLQGDRVFPELFARLEAGAPQIDVSDCPDLAPVLFALAAARNGARFTGTRRLRFKESSRAEVLAEELAKFGAEVRVSENEVSVAARGLRRPKTPLDSHGDHRVAMALSVLCTLTGGEICGAEAVGKSLPEYWDLLRSLGIGVEEERE